MLEYLKKWIPAENHSFVDSATFETQITELLRQSNSPEVRTSLGKSEQGRPLNVFHFGRGETKVVLMGGAHSDEPVGPETLRLLCHIFIRYPDQFDELFSRFQFFIFPHINPDGEAVNWKWIEDWPDIKSYLTNVYREEPGRDVEFGYPSLRKENLLISSFLSEHAPFHLHLNLHGMAYSEGAMLLIDKYWMDRTQNLQNEFLQKIKALELPLHDHDRNGDKGFRYLGPGLNTTPESVAMRQHFRERGDENTARLFHMSSMEYIRSISEDPLSLITELPMFHVKQKNLPSGKKGEPRDYLAFKEIVPKLKAHIEQGKDIEKELNKFSIIPLSSSVAIEIHLYILDISLTFIQDKRKEYFD